jgi:hypothetical protein
MPRGVIVTAVSLGMSRTTLAILLKRNGGIDV